MRAAAFLFAAIQLLGRSDAVALLRGGPSLSTLSRPGARFVMQMGDEPAEPAAAQSSAGVDPADAAVAESVATGAVDLSTLDFDQRLAVLASRIPTEVAPVEEDDGVFPEGERTHRRRVPCTMLNAAPRALIGAPETRFWNPAFWQLCAEDLKELEWPSRKSVFQTLFISQARLRPAGSTLRPVPPPHLSPSQYS